MMKYAESIWSALKDAIFTFSIPGFSSPSTVESVREMEPLGDQIAKETLACLQTAISELNHPKANSFLGLIIEDDGIEKAFNSVSGEKCYAVCSKESKRQLQALGSILSTSSKVSSVCCDRVFKKFFISLMGILEVTPNSPERSFIMKNNSFPKAVSFGAIYICVELVAACRDLTLSTEVLPQQFISMHDGWFCLLKSFATPLTCYLGSIVATLDNSISVNEDHKQEVTGYAGYNLSLFDLRHLFHL